MFVWGPQRDHIHVLDLRFKVGNCVYGEQVYKNNLIKKCTTYTKIVRYIQRRLNSYANAYENKFTMKYQILNHW